MNAIFRDYSLDEAVDLDGSGETVAGREVHAGSDGPGHEHRRHELLQLERLYALRQALDRFHDETRTPEVRDAVDGLLSAVAAADVPGILEVLRFVPFATTPERAPVVARGTWPLSPHLEGLGATNERWLLQRLEAVEIGTFVSRVELDAVQRGQPRGLDAALCRLAREWLRPHGFQVESTLTAERSGVRLPTGSPVGYRVIRL